MPDLPPTITGELENDSNWKCDYHHSPHDYLWDEALIFIIIKQPFGRRHLLDERGIGQDILNIRIFTNLRHFLLRSGSPRFPAFGVLLRMKSVVGLPHVYCGSHLAFRT